jgi:hypothetical protein
MHSCGSDTEGEAYLSAENFGPHGEFTHVDEHSGVKTDFLECTDVLFEGVLIVCP